MFILSFMITLGCSYYIFLQLYYNYLVLFDLELNWFVIFFSLVSLTLAGLFGASIDYPNYEAEREANRVERSKCTHEHTQKE